VAAAGRRPWALVQHAAGEGPGALADVLEGAGVPTVAVRLDQGAPLPDPGLVAGAAVFGGAMGVHDSDRHPWLVTERRWLVEALDRGVFVLGICLGAQQLAAALGADVHAGPEPEIGAGAVALTAEGRADPLLGPEGERVAVVQWHADTFALPEGAVRLATGARYPNQAFRFGSRAYGLQFHIEVDEAMARAWAPHLPAGAALDPGGRRAAEAAGRRIVARALSLAL